MFCTLAKLSIWFQKLGQRPLTNKSINAVFALNQSGVIQKTKHDLPQG